MILFTETYYSVSADSRPTARVNEMALNWTGLVLLSWSWYSSRGQAVEKQASQLANKGHPDGNEYCQGDKAAKHGRQRVGGGKSYWQVTGGLLRR